MVICSAKAVPSNPRSVNKRDFFTDNPDLLGRPSGFEINVREAYVSAGAGFVVVITGSIMTMPGLSKAPAAYNIDVNEDGQITGLF